MLGDAKMNHESTIALKHPTETLFSDLPDRACFRDFASKHIEPYSRDIDATENIPKAIIQKIAESGYFGAALPLDAGGMAMEPFTHGVLHEEIARSSASVAGILNVHNMAAQPIKRWGTISQQRHWLPKLSSGETIAAFAMTEPNVGTDLSAVETTARKSGHAYVLNGTKKWITAGQIADVFLVLARLDGAPSTFLVSRSASGVSTKPITGILGCRGYMLAEVVFANCELPLEALIGKAGFGLSHVAACGLDVGRYAIAWHCLGIAKACFDRSLEHVSKRSQFGTYLKSQPLIQQLITKMATDVEAACLLCWQAGHLRSRRHPSATMQTSIAKYFASVMLNKVASYAVQIHGAAGCSQEYSIERYFRDARIMEIIEGTTQIQELIIAQQALREWSLRGLQN